GALPQPFLSRLPDQLPADLRSCREELLPGRLAAAHRAVGFRARLVAVAASRADRDPVRLRLHREAQRRLASGRADAHVACQALRLPGARQPRARGAGRLVLHDRRPAARPADRAVPSLEAYTHSRAARGRQLPPAQQLDLPNRDLSMADAGFVAGVLSARMVAAPAACPATAD